MTTFLAQQIFDSSIACGLMFVTLGFVLGISAVVGAIVRYPQRVITPCQVVAFLCTIGIVAVALHEREYDFGMLLDLYVRLPGSLLISAPPAALAIAAGVIRFLRRRAVAGGRDNMRDDE